MCRTKNWVVPNYMKVCVAVDDEINISGNSMKLLFYLE